MGALDAAWRKLLSSGSLHLPPSYTTNINDFSPPGFPLLREELDMGNVSVPVLFEVFSTFPPSLFFFV